jgi:hypothetical protein
MAERCELLDLMDRLMCQRGKWRFSIYVQHCLSLVGSDLVRGVSAEIAAKGIDGSGLYFQPGGGSVPTVALQMCRALGQCLVQIETRHTAP